MAKQYTVAGRVFPTQTALEDEVKRALNSHPLNTVFGDTFLREVINTLHPSVLEAGQHCTGVFEYIDFVEQRKRGHDTAERFRGGKILLCWFEPLGDWRDVTVYPWRKSSPKNEIKKALREKIALQLPHPSDYDFCSHEGCGARGSQVEYEHVSPTFDEIATECLTLMSEDEINSKFGYSKFIPGRDHLVHCIPDDHPAVQRLVELHQSNKWEWLCSWHHRGVKPMDLVVHA